MELISPIAALIMMQASAAPPDALSATSRWLLDPIDRGCEIMQNFGGASLTFRRQPTETTSTVRLESAAVPPRVSAAMLRNERSGEEISAAAVSGDVPPRKFLQIGNVDNNFLAKLSPNSTLSFSVEGRPVAKLALADLDSALTALEQCEARLLRGWGVDPAPLAKLQAWPEPTNDPRSWVKSEDYPPSAIRVRNQSDATLRYRVTRDGKVADCAVAQSSGSLALDNAACRLVTRRARYRPALAADGSAQDAWVVQTVRWSRM